jgi:hypothetical protein
MGLKGLRWGATSGGCWARRPDAVLALFILIGAILLVVVGAIAMGVARTARPASTPARSAAWKAALPVRRSGRFRGRPGAAGQPGDPDLAGLRLSLAAPATVDQSGVRVLSVFPLTKGQVLALLVGLALAAARSWR